MSRRLSHEQLSRALSEHCGPGLQRGGYNLIDKRRCLFQAALNSDEALPIYGYDPLLLEKFDCEYMSDWTPEELLSLVESFDS